MQRRCRSPPRWVASFNPHPPVGGCNCSSSLRSAALSMFQSSPARGGGCNMGRASSTASPPAFQSSPARGGGCNSSSSNSSASRVSFQSSPARGGGCNAAVIAGTGGWAVVSILTRPWGRVQPQRAIAISSAGASFNPHPPVGAGATHARSISTQQRARFNPHPPVGAGATKAGRTTNRYGTSFQSSPARGGGCN